MVPHPAFFLLILGGVVVGPLLMTYALLPRRVRTWWLAAGIVLLLVGVAVSFWLVSRLAFLDD